MKVRIKALGEWLRNAIRVVIWKQWKLPRKRMQSLIRLGLSKNEAKCISNSRKGTKAISNLRLKKKGLLDPLEYYLEKIA